MEKFSIDYIVGLINRKEPLPKQFNKALSTLVDLTLNRGLYALTLEELLDQLLIKIDGPRDITKDYCLNNNTLYKLVSILYRNKICMIPMSVPNNLPLINTVHLLKVPDLMQDPDVAAIQELKKNAKANPNYTNSQYITSQNALTKINNFNILSRVFEGLGAMQTRALDVNQRSALSNILNERVLPHDGNRYIRCLFGYVCDYGSFTYDYSNKLYVLGALNPEIQAEVIDIIARVLSASKVKLQVQPTYPYAKELQAAYNKYCPVEQAHDDPFVSQVMPQRIPVSMRPLSKLNAKQKQKRLLTDLSKFKRNITDDNIESFLQPRQGFSDKFIQIAQQALYTADKDLTSFLQELNKETLKDTSLRLMLPNLDKCELYVETLDLHPYLKPENSEFPRAERTKSTSVDSNQAATRKNELCLTSEEADSSKNVNELNTTYNSPSTKQGTALSASSEQASPTTDYTLSTIKQSSADPRSRGVVGKNGVGTTSQQTMVFQSPVGADSSKSNGLDAPSKLDLIASTLTSIEKGFTYTSFAQAIANGESLNAISCTWDELTHFYYSFLIYSKDKDYLNPNKDEDYCVNLEQFLKQPLKQITSRVNPTNFFEFVLKPMLTGQFTARQQQFFETQIGNAYLFKNANPLPFVFCHGLFIFDKYLMQPKHHFSNEMFYLNLFAREPYAINLYLTRVINKYGEYLINIPEEFYELIALYMLIFPQDHVSSISYTLAHWLFGYPHSSTNLGRVVALHILAYKLYHLVKEDPEYRFLKLTLVKDPRSRDAMLRKKQIETLSNPEPTEDSDDQEFANRKVAFKYFASTYGLSLEAYAPEEKDEDSDLPLGEVGNIKDNASFDLYQKDLQKAESSRRSKKSLLSEVNSRLNKKQQDAKKEEDLPDECNQHLNPLFGSHIYREDTNYPQPSSDDPLAPLIEGFMYPALKRIVTSENQSIYMFNKVLDSKLTLMSVFNTVTKHIPDTMYDELSRNRFIIDSFVFQDEPKDLQTLKSVALLAETSYEIGFAQGIPTKYLGEISDILFHNLQLQLVPNYLILSPKENYAKLRPVVHYIDFIEVPNLFRNPNIYSAYQDVLLSLNNAVAALDLLRAMLSQIPHPKDLIEEMVKDIIASHNMQNYKPAIPFVYNYLSASYKLIDKEGRLNIDVLCSDDVNLDQILCHQKSVRRLHRMLKLGIDHLINNSKTTSTVQERYIKLLIKLKIKEPSLLNQLHQMNPDTSLLRTLNTPMPKQTFNPAQLDMSKIKLRQQESSEVQAVITKMREEEAQKEAELFAQEHIALKERVAQYQQQQIALGTAPTKEQIDAVSKRVITSDANLDEDRPLESNLSAEPNSLKNSQSSPLATQSAPSGDSTSSDTKDQALQQKILDLAPVASKLSSKAQNLVDAVLSQNAEVMDLREFNGLCVSYRYMSANAAIEEINDVCLEEFDDLLFEADPEQGVIYITKEILEDLGAQCAKIKELSGSN